MRIRSLLAAGALCGASFASADTLFASMSFTNVTSVDGYGDPNNVVFNIDMGLVFPGYGNFTVTSVGWDVTLTANSPSWLSEMAVELADSTTLNDWFWINPGAGNNVPGTMSFNSGGQIDLVGTSQEVTLNPDGILRLEFFELLDDFPNGVDGVWHDGSKIDVELEGSLVPEPATLTALGLGGLALLRRRR